MRRPALPCLSLFVLSSAIACRGDDSSRSSGAADSAHAQVSAGQPAAPKFAPNSFAADRTELTDASAELQTKLEAGRAALAAEDLQRALAELGAAAVLDPVNPELLTQLGATALRAGRLPEARHHLSRALRHAETPTQRGELLALLGRVAEARGDRMRASELYVHSLALAPNELIRHQLAALTGGAEVISNSACGWREQGPAPARLCPAYLETLGPVEAGEAARRCALEPSEDGASTPGTLELDAETKLATFSYHDPTRAIEVIVLNALIGESWYSHELSWLDHPEARYADENLGALELRAEQLAPGGPLEVVVEWSIEGRAVELGAAELTQRDHELDYLAVLMLHRGKPDWLIGLSTSRTLRSGAFASPTIEQQRESVSLEWLTKTGEVEIGEGEDPPSAPTGRHGLGAYSQLCAAELERP